VDYKESIKRSIQFLVEADVPEYGNSKKHTKDDRDIVLKKIEILLKDIRSEAGVYIQQEKNDFKLDKYFEELMGKLLEIRAIQIGKPNMRDTMKDVADALDKEI